MSRKPCFGNVWAEHTLDRAHRIGERVLERTKARKVEWPKPKNYGCNPVKDPHVYTSLDDALASMLHYMSISTRNCGRYFKSIDEAQKNTDDALHCRRFHTSAYPVKRRQNPLQRTEDVHVVVEPGTYAVSAGSWGSGSQQTQVVHMPAGNSVNLDFVL